MFTVPAALHRLMDRLRNETLELAAAAASKWNRYRTMYLRLL